MKKILIILLILIISLMSMDGKGILQVKILEDIQIPDTIAVGDDYIYITQKCTVFIYSQKDLSLVRRFGKQGEGPEEFKVISYSGTGLNIDLQPGRLLISSIGKLSLFSPGGRFLKSFRTRANVFGNEFHGLGEGFIGNGSVYLKDKNYQTVNIYDSDMQLVKEVCRWENPYRPGRGTAMYTTPYIFTTAGGKIYASKGRDFDINIFDSTGRFEKTIHHDIPKHIISSSHKEEIIRYFKTSPSTKDIFQYMLPISFPKEFPVIYNFFIRDSSIYVFTYLRKNGARECFRLDMDGKIGSTFFIPVQNMTVLNTFPFDIRNGKLYQLVENEGDENWELQISEISRSE